MGKFKVKSSFIVIFLFTSLLVFILLYLIGELIDYPHQTVILFSLIALYIFFIFSSFRIAKSYIEINESSIKKHLYNAGANSITCRYKEISSIHYNRTTRCILIRMQTGEVMHINHYYENFNKIGAELINKHHSTLSDAKISHEFLDKFRND